METELIKWGGWIAGACASFILYFFPARRKELDQATAKLIKTLQETVGALERDLNTYKERTITLEKNQNENMSKIAGIEAEKQLLRDFIAGRDKETTTFQTEAMALHRLNSEKIGQLVDMLGKHFLNLERSVTK